MQFTGQTKLASLAAILAAVMLLIHWPPFPPVVTYALAFVFSSVVFLVFARELSRTDPGHRSVSILIGVALLVRLSFLTVVPIGSDDVYRYMWDGRLQSQGVNPYRFAPDAPELSSYHTKQLPALVNHQDLKTVYFPLSQWMSLAGYLLSGEQVWGYKLLLLVAELATLLGLIALLKRLGIPEKYVLLYALCPLPILQFAVDAHIDGFGLPLLVGGIFLYVDHKKILAYLLIALSISIKPVALLVLPVFFWKERGVWNRAFALAVPFAVVAGSFLPYAMSANVFDGLLRFAGNWSFNGAVFETLFLLLPNNQDVRILCALLLITLIILVALRRENSIEAFYLSVLFLLLLSPVVHPWYVTWLAVLVPIVRRWSGIVFAASCSLTIFTVVSYQLHGTWVQSPFVLIIEYLPVLVLLVLELRRPGTTHPVRNP